MLYSPSQYIRDLSVLFLFLLTTFLLPFLLSFFPSIATLQLFKNKVTPFE